MREFSQKQSFDVVLNLYTSFGYFEDRNDDLLTARNFYESLKEGGQLAMALTSKEVLASQFEPKTWNEQDGNYHLEEHEITNNWSWIENRWILVDEGRAREFEVSHRLYSGYELSQLLKQVGFDEISLFGDFEGAPYDNNAEQLVVTAQK